MAHNRVKKGRPVSGWLILDKPIDLGSTPAVSRIKWLFGARKAGHAGTLDPLATGVLPIALGEATKTVPYVVDGTKAYRFTVKWGLQTSTDDTEGEPVATSDARPEKAAIEALLPAFTGIINQVPPAFSAIKINGERAYKKARDGEDVELAAREIEIDALSIVRYSADETVFEVECGKGTYVRALARDLGIKLGCLGHVSDLRRTLVDPFEEADTVTMAELDALEEAHGDDLAARRAALDALLISAGEAMDGYPRIDVDDKQATRIRLGNPAFLGGRDAPIAADDACAFHNGNLLAIGDIAQGAFKPKRVLQG
ncbi:MAG: tRNA pseudouridine(55) synthase TruB [Pseudomonadota bacterium]